MLEELRSYLLLSRTKISKAMLKYSLVENLLTVEQDDFMAHPTEVRSYSVDEIIEQMLKRGTLLTKADISAVLEVYHQVIADVVEEGGAIHTPLINTTPSISGVFKGAEDTFDPKRHHVKVNVNPGKLLREAAPKIKVTKVHVDDPLPYILEVKDILSGKTNAVLTHGGVVQISGGKLKFYADKPNNGLFLVDEHNAEIRCKIIVENKPARIIAIIPEDIPKTAYRLEIRTTFSNYQRECKTLKIGQFNKLLTAI
jgi:hypothetical protein